MWTKPAVRAHNAALAVCAKWKEAIDRLALMAQYNPAFAETVKDLKAMCENLEAQSRIAIAVDPTGSDK